MQLLIFTLGGNIFIPSNEPIQYNDLVCRGCPAQWDKLTDAEKDAKLAKVGPKPVKKHSVHKH